MALSSVHSRYDEFQEEAVLACLDDFGRKSSGRFLLVIPTGGGKTFTAVKTINRMFAEDILNHETDKVMWVAHRQELIEQASDTFDKFKKIYPNLPTFKDNVDFIMVSKSSAHLKTNTNTRLVVIDEAHHSAAKSYVPMFQIRPEQTGVLGLTATPTRYDNEILPFERESYSIGFPDLVNLGVILRPDVHIIRGGKYIIDDLKDDAQLEQLNDQKRNNEIVKAIQADTAAYRKIVIYAATKKHAEDLTAFLEKSPVSDLYESIGFIHGSKNSRNEDRATFLATEKTWNRAILVNVGILSEGYDDPTINTVIMAAPTRSKLVYMQAIGRAVRHDPDDDLKRAYIIEIEDELPNIRYRIDNRWLYADISDALEPVVIDKEYETEDELKRIFADLYRSFNVPAENQTKPKIEPNDRYSMLLFRVYSKGDKFSHYPILINNDNRLQISNFFNFYSEQMKEFVAKEYNLSKILSSARYDDISSLESTESRQLVFDAMRNSVSQDEFIVSRGPWVTFVSCRVKRRGSFISVDLEEFLNTLVNKEDIKKSILAASYPEGSVLVRLPLPLGDYIGQILHSLEFESLKQTVAELGDVKQEFSGKDHRTVVRGIMDSSVLPLQYGNAASILTIVRDSTDYFRKL
jgi:superfamily II DNA or RNA helicase